VVVVVVVVVVIVMVVMVVMVVVDNGLSSIYLSSSPSKW